MATTDRPIVTYKQLLSLAHERGLTSISTDLIQMPTAENQYTAYFRATVTLEMDGLTKVFSAYADASPANTKAAMHTCLPRLAETRAKARCLRDAVNIGEVAAEELPDYSEPPGARSSRAAASGKMPLVEGDSPCPKCHAPGGKPHATGCTALRVAA